MADCPTQIVPEASETSGEATKNGSDPSHGASAEPVDSADSPKQSTRAERFQTFLNTNFGLWLATLIVINIFGYVFADARKWCEAYFGRSELRRKIDGEISHRARNARALAKSTTRAQSGAHYLRSVVDALDGGPMISQNRFLYPDFQNRGFKSLVAELSNLCDPKERPTLKLAEQTYDALSAEAAPQDFMGMFGMPVSEKEPRGIPASKRDAIASIITRNLITPRWHLEVTR